MGRGNSMRVEGLFQTPWRNYLRILCECGCEFFQNEKKWTVRCPECGNIKGLESLRGSLGDNVV